MCEILPFSQYSNVFKSKSFKTGPFKCPFTINKNVHGFKNKEKQSQESQNERGIS